MAPFAEEHTGSNFATKPTASSCTQKKWWSRLEKDLRKMGLFHFSMLTCSPTAWRSCTSCAHFCGTCVLLQTTRGGSNFHRGLFLLKTAEDGHGAVCRVLDNYYYPGEEESAKAWNSTLYIYMGVGEGDDKGSGPRQWEMYLALETCCQMIHFCDLLRLSYLQGARSKRAAGSGRADACTADAVYDDMTR